MLKCQDLHEGDSLRRDVFLLPLGFLIHALGEELVSPEIGWIHALGEESATPGHCSWIQHLFLVQAYILSLTLLTAGLSWPGKPWSMIKDIIYFSPVIPDLGVTLRSLVCPHAGHLPTPSHWAFPAPFRNLEPKVPSTQKPSRCVILPEFYCFKVALSSTLGAVRVSPQWHLLLF